MAVGQTTGEQAFFRELVQDIEHAKNNDPTRVLNIEYYTHGATEKWLEREMLDAWNQAGAKATTYAVQQVGKADKLDLVFATRLAKGVGKVLAKYVSQGMFGPLDTAISTTYMGAKNATVKRAKGVYTTLGLETKHVTPSDRMVTQAKANAKGLADYATLKYPRFSLKDWKAINVMRKQQAMFVLRYAQTYQPDITQYIRESILEPGIETRQAGRMLRAKFGHLFQNGPTMARIHPDTYFEGLAQHIVSTARVTGTIQTFSQLGVKTYRWVSMLDRAVCETCAYLEDKVWTVQQAMDNIQQVLNASTPEAAIAAHPWLDKDQIIQATGVTTPGYPGNPATALTESQRMADANVTHPPIHFRCRCTLDIDFRTITEETQPFTVPEKWTDKTVMNAIETGHWEALIDPHTGLSSKDWLSLDMDTRRAIFKAAGQAYYENGILGKEGPAVYVNTLMDRYGNGRATVEEIRKRVTIVGTGTPGKGLSTAQIDEYLRENEHVYSMRALDKIVVTKRPLTISVGEIPDPEMRSFYSDGRNLIALQHRGINKAVFVHEFGHFMELQSEYESSVHITRYMTFRTKGERSVRLKKLFPKLNYDRDEITKKDKWWHPYVGKVYGDSKNPYKVSAGTEFLSMGVQGMYEVEVADGGFGDAALKNMKEDPEYWGLVLLFRLGALSL